MLVHTRSPWLTVVGLIQIIISFPLAYFVYSVVLRLTFFPFLNFIGVFVTFALGADDVFVACDKVTFVRCFLLVFLRIFSRSILFCCVAKIGSHCESNYLLGDDDFSVEEQPVGISEGEH